MKVLEVKQEQDMVICEGRNIFFHKVMKVFVQLEGGHYGWFRVYKNGTIKRVGYSKGKWLKEQLLNASYKVVKAREFLGEVEMQKNFERRYLDLLKENRKLKMQLANHKGYRG